MSFATAENKLCDTQKKVNNIMEFFQNISM
jgi:hypothetical protein